MRGYLVIFILIPAIFAWENLRAIPSPPEFDKKCQLPQELIQEIQNYRPIAQQIMSEITFEQVHQVHKEIEKFVDVYDQRAVGYEGLEKSIDYMISKMKNELGDENVWTEDVNATGWIIGQSLVNLVYPREMEIKSLSIGNCGSTPEAGIEAEIIVARTLEELVDFGNQVMGKIVVFNYEYHNITYARQFRYQGIFQAVKQGAVGVMVKSTTPLSLNTLHVASIPFGYYEDGVEKIPSVTITVEDAEFLWRIYKRSDATSRPKVHLKVFGDEYPDVKSRNIFGQIRGKDLADEITIISGHIDNVMLGDGSGDDANGVLISTEALRILKKLNLQPRRTLQAVVWTAEEIGLWGALSFMKNHKHEMEKYNAAFESDIGTFKPLGLDFYGSDDASCIVKEVLKLTSIMGADNFRKFPHPVSSDIMYMQMEGVPGFDIYTDNDEYFWYHHSKADRFNILDPDNLDSCLALWTISSYVISDLSISLPRGNSSQWIVD